MRKTKVTRGALIAAARIIRYAETMYAIKGPRSLIGLAAIIDDSFAQAEAKTRSHFRRDRNV